MRGGKVFKPLREFIRKHHRLPFMLHCPFLVVQNRTAGLAPARLPRHEGACRFAITSLAR